MSILPNPGEHWKKGGPFTRELPRSDRPETMRQPVTEDCVRALELERPALMPCGHSWEYSYYEESGTHGRVVSERRCAACDAEKDKTMNKIEIKPGDLLKLHEDGRYKESLYRVGKMEDGTHLKEPVEPWAELRPIGTSVEPYQVPLPIIQAALAVGLMVLFRAVEPEKTDNATG